MKNKKRIIIMIFIIIIIIIMGLFIYLYINKKKDNNELEDVKVINKIEKYNYFLNDNETTYYKDKFNELLNLGEENIDDREFISLVTSLFLSDYYTLDNKIDNLDIGGLQFIYKDEQDDFLTVSKNTIYKYIKNNYNGDRTQKLPIVIDVIINEIKEIEDNYQVSASIKYQEDLGYQSEVTLTFVKDNNKFSIIELK